MSKPQQSELLALNEAKLSGFDDQAVAQSFEDWLHEVSPTFFWHWRHLVYVRAQLNKVTEGIHRFLMLQVPPRHGKSEMVTVRYSAYRLEHDHNLPIIIGAYSQFLANKFSRKVKRLLAGRVEFSRERSATEEWELQVPSYQQPGGVRAVGVGAGVTGTGGKLIMIDDPVKNRAEANSETYREAVAEWYSDDIYTRLEPDGALCLTMTRWHEDDIAGRIRRNEFGDADQWVFINLPALAEDNDPLGRPMDEALCPERYDFPTLMRIKKVLGESFAALYQGRPVAASGNIIKSAWFRYYNTPPRKDDVLMIVQSWDTGTKAKQINDPSVCTTWAITRLAYYLLDVYRERVEFPDLVKARDSQAERWAPTAILIEDKGNGSALLQDAKSNTQLPVIAIEPEGDKILRLSAESPSYEAGLVYHPQSAPWLLDFETELKGIPNVPNDDQGDSVSQFLKWIRTRSQGFELFTSGVSRTAQGAYS